MASILYLTYDGLTDPLGQSQILPYIHGLNKVGHKFTIISFEKKEQKRNLHQLKSNLNNQGIKWHPLSYTKSPPVLATLYDLIRMYNSALRLHKINNFSIVHCRSYPPAIVGLKLRNRRHLKLIFDMRDFWPDERIDGNLWNVQNPVYFLVYKYFKWKELQLWRTADRIITLTEKATNIISKLGIDRRKMITIPTCVEIEYFSKDSGIAFKKNSFNINPDDFVISYLGSLGTWYRTKELLVLFKKILDRNRLARLMVISKSPKSHILSEIQSLNIPITSVIFASGNRSEIPYLLSFSNWSIFFYKATSAKAGTSPTKLGELVSMRIPVITNTGVGDVEEYFSKYELGVLVRDIENDKELESAADFVLKHPNHESDINLVYDKFDLKKAVISIDLIYKELQA